MTIDPMQFIREVFRDLPQGAAPVVAGFAGDPSVNANWRPYAVNGHLPSAIAADSNNYYAISSVRADESGAFRRRAEFAAAVHVIVIDDVGLDRPRSKRSKSRRRRDEDDDDVSEALADIEDDEDEPAQVMVGPAQPARWGPLPALVLFPCLFVMIIIMFMGFELLHGMWSYRSGGSKPTYTITRGIAGMFKAEADLPKD